MLPTLLPEESNSSNSKEPSPLITLKLPREPKRLDTVWGSPNAVKKSFRLVRLTVGIVNFVLNVPSAFTTFA